MRALIKVRGDFKHYVARFEFGGPEGVPEHVGGQGDSPGAAVGSLLLRAGRAAGRRLPRGQFRVARQ